MGGGLMQLVAYGAQDIYLTGNPQITFFKVVYRRHTNFSMEEIAQSASGTVDFGREATYTISRNGDLVHKMYFEYTMNNNTSSGAASRVSNFGNTLLKEVEVEIGGQKIDTHYSHWLTTWSDLTEPNVISSNCTLEKMREIESTISDDRYQPTLYQKMSGNIFQNDSDDSASELNNVNKYQVPLRFWFNRNPGLALPLIALQYHEVKIKINFEELSNLLTLSGLSLLNGRLFVQYIYLDTDERRRFAQVSHEYLIEQLQFQKGGGQSKNFDLNFNHPIKELIWGGSNVSFSSDSSASGGNGQTQTILRGSNLRCDKTTMRPSIENGWKIVLNGHDRMSFRHSTYFTRQQIYDYHTGSGSVCDSDCIAVYSFALKPEEHQPSGTCNFSRIDTAELVSKTPTNGNINIYAINYNVLRIMSGMGGLAYSN